MMQSFFVIHPFQLPAGWKFSGAQIPCSYCNILEFLWNVREANMWISKFRFEIECIIKM
jgi:hypothetical protein